MLTINNEKAIGLAKEKLRQWREVAFKANDIRIQNALVDGDEDARMKAVSYRDYLRDLPEQCTGKSIGELKAIMDGTKEYDDWAGGNP